MTPSAEIVIPWTSTADGRRRTSQLTPTAWRPEEIAPGSLVTSEKNWRAHSSASRAQEISSALTMIANDGAAVTMAARVVHAMVPRSIHVVIGPTIVDFPATAVVGAPVVHDRVAAR